MTTFQKCNLEHFPLLFDIALQSYKDAYIYLWDDEGIDYIKKNYSRQLWEAELATGKANYFLVYHSQKAVGYFKIKENGLAPFSQEDCLEIEKLYFLKSFTGKGMGKSTLSFIENLALLQHKKLIWVNVMENSPASSFYKLNGFGQVHTTYLNYAHMKEEFRTLATFTKQVKPVSG